MFKLSEFKTELKAFQEKNLFDKFITKGFCISFFCLSLKAVLRVRLSIHCEDLILAHVGIQNTLFPI